MADLPNSVSQASLFFEALPEDNAAAHQKLSSMVVGEPQLEAEWIDYKTGLSDDNAVKKHWGKALSGFGNSSGGLIVWGVATRSMPGGLDAPSHLEHAPDAAKLEARLNQLVNTSADPPVLGVRFRRVTDPSGDGRAGLVVALIPSSDLAPHRDEGTKIFTFVPAISIIPHEPGFYVSSSTPRFFPSCVSVLKRSTSECL